MISEKPDQATMRPVKVSTGSDPAIREIVCVLIARCGRFINELVSIGMDQDLTYVTRCVEEQEAL